MMNDTTSFDATMDIIWSKEYGGVVGVERKKVKPRISKPLNWRIDSKLHMPSGDGKQMLSCKDDTPWEIGQDKFLIDKKSGMMLKLHIQDISYFDDFFSFRSQPNIDMNKFASFAYRMMYEEEVVDIGEEKGITMMINGGFVLYHLIQSKLVK